MKMKTKMIGWLIAVVLTSAQILFLGTALAQGKGSSMNHPAPKAYLGEFESNDIAVVNTADNSIIKRISVPKGVHGVAITPDGSRVFVSSDAGNTITVIDTTKDEIASSILTLTEEGYICNFCFLLDRSLMILFQAKMELKLIWTFW